ncbi:MAG: DUF2723 domain-containing protein [Firmicutes bacterium]|nr:DUF2723 domain-containing protein [Bacillota bacterium]
MKDRWKTLLCFLVVVLICLTFYLVTVSNNFISDSDILLLALMVEGKAPYAMDFEFAHLGWMPCCKFAYRTWNFFGYKGGSIFPLQIFNIFISSMAVGFIFLSIHRLTRKFIISAIIALIFGFSLSFWVIAVNNRPYPTGTLFLAISFYLLVIFLEGANFFIFFSGIFCGMANWFHLTNFYLFFAGVTGILLKKEAPAEKFKNFFLYLGGFSAAFLIPFIILLVKTAFKYVDSMGGSLADTMIKLLSVKIGFQADWQSYFNFVTEFSSKIIPLPFNKYIFIAFFLLILAASWKIIKTSLIPGACAFVWFITVFLGTKLAVPLNTNSYNIWLPLLMLFSMAFAPAKEGERSFLSSLGQKGGTVVAFLFLLVVFLTNFKFYLLPQHSPESDAVQQSVLFINKNLKESDYLITVGLPSIYSKYFGNFKVIDLEYIFIKYRAEATESFPANQLLQEINEDIKRGGRVFLADETKTNFQSYAFSMAGLTEFNFKKKTWNFNDIRNFLEKNFRFKENANTPGGWKLMELISK